MQSKGGRDTEHSFTTAIPDTMSRPPRLCLTCNRLTTTGSRCPPCTIAFSNARYARRGYRPWYGAEYQAARRELLKTQQVCQKCGESDRLEVDHVLPRSMSQGLIVLCKKCHQAKPDRENEARR